MARDSIDMTQIHVKEAEQQALADQALAEFAAAEGISLGGETAAPVANRSMGGTAAEPPLADSEKT